MNGSKHDRCIHHEGEMTDVIQIVFELAEGVGRVTQTGPPKQLVWMGLM